MGTGRVLLCHRRFRCIHLSDLPALGKWMIISGIILLLFSLSLIVTSLDAKRQRQLLADWLPARLIPHNDDAIMNAINDDAEDLWGNDADIGTIPGRPGVALGDCLNGDIAMTPLDPSINKFNGSDCWDFFNLAPLVKYNSKEQIFIQPEINDDEAAQRFAQIISTKYFSKIRQSILKRWCHPKFLVFACSNDLLCGGLGDRMRGVIGLLYLAMATNRILHIDWDKPPGNVADFFTLNADLYFHGFSSDAKSTAAYTRMYNKKLRQSKRRKAAALVTFLDRPAEWPYSKFAAKMLAGNRTGNPLADDAEYLQFNTNSFIPLIAVLPHNNETTPLPSQIAFLEEYFPTESKKLCKNNRLEISVPVLVSAGIRSLFSLPQPRLGRAFDGFVMQSAGNGDVWRRLLKIGVQIRTGMTLYEQVHGRVEKMSQKLCFVREIEGIIERLSSGAAAWSTGFLVFVTSDSQEVADFVIDQLNRRAAVNGHRVALMRTVKTPGEAIHIDKVNEVDGGVVTEQDAVKPFVDFYLLSKMDRLLISRSGYGEMAALFSFVPTGRFRRIFETIIHSDANSSSNNKNSTSKFRFIDGSDNKTTTTTTTVATSSTTTTGDNEPVCYFENWGLTSLQMEKK